MLSGQFFKVIALGFPKTGLLIGGKIIEDSLKSGFRLRFLKLVCPDLTNFFDKLLKGLSHIRIILALTFLGKLLSFFDKLQKFGPLIHAEPPNPTQFLGLLFSMASGDGEENLVYIFCDYLWASDPQINNVNKSMASMNSTLYHSRFFLVRSSSADSFF